MPDKKNLNHVAIICDGNRRWAQQRGLEVFKGHEHAVDHVFEPLIKRAIDHGITHITFWIFSTENWQRHQREVQFLLKLFRKFFDEDIEKLHRHGVKLNAIGRLADFPADIQAKLQTAIDQTSANTAITATFAMSYGGRDELTRAVQALASQAAAGQLQPADITPDTISQQLDTADLPDPDLIIRTGGDQRLSGFMLWQSEYAELLFPEFWFPDFFPEKLDEAVEEFHQRQRRFGR